MLKKLIVFAITSGLAAKLVRSYLDKQKASSAPAANTGTTPQRYSRRAD